ncbi:acyl-CoA/acyl-ACP dehydrogenase [Shewanella submarina]|uniref:Acyl-CoA dehydrogenase family protein n=1 Tax=Shewanella submarina TaxID=2016376 RepID=A0ABV7GH60_9GAMM|nr:acyl-CoA dehydrogenase family protein [Shewanella submarina]MCL1037984.1 acyl-CoA/acyl-ACP dehydrogenase [Shewanella submarina]
MDFTFTEDELAFREAISRFLMTEAAPETLREIWETDSGRSPELRSKIAEQGLTALSVPEEAGGLGLGDVAWSLMTQELGYYGIPDSMADTAYVATGLLSALPVGEKRDAWLEQVAAGELRIAVGHGCNSLVADAQSADLLLVHHTNQNGDIELHAIERALVDVTPHSSIDSSRRLARISWQPTDDSLVVSGDDAEVLLAETLNRGALSVAGQLLGLAQRMLDLSVDYVAQRKQFGRAIGSFQAVKHHLADVAAKIEFARPVLYRAAWALQNQTPDAELYVSQAKLACIDAAALAARHGIQVHGAMGYTWEVDLQMFMKRSWALIPSWGDRSFHQARVNDNLFSRVAADNQSAGPESTFGRQI